MNSNTVFFRLGPANCLSPEWREEYYPEDLPPEWLLVYLANEFPCVLLDQQDRRLIENISGIEWPPGLSVFYFSMAGCEVGEKCIELSRCVATHETVHLEAVTLYQRAQGLWQSLPANSDAAYISLSTATTLDTVRQHFQSLDTDRGHYFFLAAAPQLVHEARQLSEIMAIG